MKDRSPKFGTMGTEKRALGEWAISRSFENRGSNPRGDANHFKPVALAIYGLSCLFESEVTMEVTIITPRLGDVY